MAAPLSIVSALAYYIGVVRQEELVRHFGLDVSLLEFSTRDYVLRSVDALLRFLVGVCVLTVVLIAAYLLFDSRLQASSRQVRPAAAWGLVLSGGAGVALGAWRLTHPVPLRGMYLLGPVALGVGALLIAYGGQQLLRNVELSRLAFTAAAGAIVALVLVALFWAASDYARVQGRGRARQLERAFGARPAAVVYSDTRLHLGAPGVQEDVLDNSDGNALYRYRGLRLLIRSGDKYFLLPTPWDRRHGAVVVLPDSDAIRLEFRPASAS